MSDWTTSVIETALSPICRIQILTYLIWGFLGAAIFDCIIRSCDLFYWFIRTCLGPTVVPAAITSLELFCVLTMCYFSDNVSSKENIKILYYKIKLLPMCMDSDNLVQLILDPSGLLPAKKGVMSASQIDLHWQARRLCYSLHLERYQKLAIIPSRKSKKSKGKIGRGTQ